MRTNKFKLHFLVLIFVLILFTILSEYSYPATYAAPSNGAPVPLLNSGHPVAGWVRVRTNAQGRHVEPYHEHKTG